MKRLLALILVLIMLFAACAPKETPDNTSDTSSEPAGTGEFVTALRIGGLDIGANEFRYHYYSVVQSIVSVYGSYMGIDMDTPFEEQPFDDTMTWADFFKEQALQSLRNAVILSEQAKKENMTLFSVFNDDIQKQIDSLVQYCEQESKTFNEALGEYYGGNMDETELRAIMERMYLGYQFEIYKRGSFDVSEETMEEYYSQNSADYDETDYLLYRFLPEYGDDGYTVIDSSEAKAGAEAFLENITDRESFGKYVSDVLEEDTDGILVENGINEGDAVSAWLYDVTRNEGDKTVVETDGIYNVLYFINRYLPQNTSLSVRHVLIASEDSTAEAARARAEELYTEWKNGPGTEHSFADLAWRYSQDPGSISTGGLYEDIQEGQMVDPFNDWCFDPSRKYGDTGLVDTTYGTHIMYYVGNVPSWQSGVKASIVENEYSEFYNALLPQYEVEEINMDVSK